jgi:hypothetical protein
MSGQYKVAWLCEAPLVPRSGYYDWKERRRQPGPRQLENTRLRARIQEEFARSRQTYGSPRLAGALGCPGRRNRIARVMRQELIFAPATLQVSSQDHRQRPRRPHCFCDPVSPARLAACPRSLAVVQLTSSLFHVSMFLEKLTERHRIGRFVAGESLPSVARHRVGIDLRHLLGE